MVDHQSYASAKMDSEITEEESEVEDFDSKLISKVKLYPLLYNNKKGKVNEITEMWQNIARDLGDSVDACKSRWIRLRQYYAKERQKRFSGKRGQWALFDKMNFLQHYVKHKKHPKISLKPTENQNNSTSLELQGEETVEVDLNVNNIMEIDSIPIILDPHTSTSNLNDLTAMTTNDSTNENNENSNEKQNEKICERIPMSDVGNVHKNEKKMQDKENKAVSDLVISKLENLKDISNRNCLIRKLIDIMFD